LSINNINTWPAKDPEQIHSSADDKTIICS